MSLKKSKKQNLNEKFYVIIVYHLDDYKDQFKWEEREREGRERRKQKVKTLFFPNANGK